jgi:hypothetical protein
MIKFKDVQAYLDAIAAKNGAIDGSPHGAFWQVDYATFTTGNVPGVVPSVSIMNQQAPLQSPFFVILTNSNGWQGNPQMPDGGPYITDAGYQVTLADGTQLTGQQIIDNLTEWLNNGFPQ